MLTAALFELDGVLVDVAAARAAALMAAFAAEGMSVDAGAANDPAAPTDPVGWLAPFEDLAVILAPGAPDDVALALVALRAEDHYAARRATGITLAPGAREAVAALAAECRIGVVAGWRRAEVERTLALAGLDAVVRVVVAADDGPPFPSPADRVMRALTRLRPPGAPPETVVAVLASPAALAAAHDAGARTVLVTPGLAAGPPSGVRRLRTHAVRADARFPSLNGLTSAALAAALGPTPRSPAHAPRR